MLAASTASPAKRPSVFPPPKVHHKPVPAAVSSVSPDYTRLHITPFDADLLPVVLPASLRPDAHNISFHQLATFPEKRYGFVDLPADAAVKLRRKLNGAVLKGVKLRIEPARQSREEVYAQERALIAEEMAKRTAEEKALCAEEKRERRERKALRDQEKQDRRDKQEKTRTGWDKLAEAKNKRQEIAGVQLTDRPVKRGWTEPATAADEPEAKRKYHTKEDKEKARQERKEKKAKKQREKSAFTEKPECLFKTVLPASKVPMNTDKDAAADGAPLDDRAAKRQRKKQQKAREVVVHEFANWTRIPNFIKSAGGGDSGAAASTNLEYVDGKGWVNADSGAVVEPLKSTRSNAVTALVTKEEQLAKRARYEARKAEAAAAQTASDSETSDSETSDSGSDTSSDESSSDEEEEEEEDEKDEEETTEPPRPKSSGSTKGLSITIPPPPPSSPPPPTTITTTTTTAAAADVPPLTPAKVHPLEALYKRTVQDQAAAATTSATTTGPAASASADTKPAAEPTPFSFFGDIAGDDIEEEEDDVDAMHVDVTEPVAETATTAVTQPPMTPFTKQDVEWRNTRSAAPTPDTAHPSRRSKPVWAANDEEEEEEEEEEDDSNSDNDAAADDDNTKTKADAAADFSSWFWENRGDLNRSWKRRRKTAAKEKRYRENRARNERAI